MKKRMSRFFISFSVLILSLVPLSSFPEHKAHAYANALGNVINTSVTGDTILLTIDNGAEPNDDLLEIKVLKTNILKVNYRPNGVAQSPDTPMIDPNKTWAAAGATINTTSNPIVVSTSKMKIEIQKNPCRMTIKKADGTTLLWEPATGGVFYDGVRFVHPVNHNIYGIRSYNAFEGGGDILRNNNAHGAHAGEQGDAGGPFMWSTAGYGLLVDSDGGYPYTDEVTGKMEFYYGGTPTEGRRYTKTDLDYYVMLGDPNEIMDAASEITGRAPMLPKWALGFSNFEWDTNETEMTSMVDTYRAKNIPIDSYGLDYDWKKYGEDQYGEFKWNTTKFPSSSSTAFKTTMDNKGIKMIGITKPRIVTQLAGGQRTVQYNDAQAGGYWYPGHNEYQDYFIPVNVRSIDPYNANARTWLWNNSKDAFDKGIVGWWNDETDKVSSGAAQYWFGNFTTTHLSQALFEGQNSYTNKTKRVWQTARTYYPGAQRYGTTLWSGDIGIQFKKGEKIDWAAGMEDQRAVMLSSVNLGQAKWGMDTGGFNQQDGSISNPSPELYARWMQFSAFTPVFRVHGNNFQQRQPWFYGATAEEISKSSIQLRYKLLPYMYSYERSAYENGKGLVRPLIFDYPNDQNVKNNVDSWMFGDYMLVSPVVGKQQASKNIYLPSGTWIDYFKGKTYSGNQTISYPVNAETWTDVPLFIKKGAIIPSQKAEDYVGQSSVKTIYVDTFPDSTETTFNYYDDDGTSYGYESTSHLKQFLSVKDNGASGINVKINGKTGTYNPSLEYYIFKVHGKAATSVTNNGSALSSQSNLQALQSFNGEGWAVGKDEYGDVTYVKVAAKSTSLKNIVLNGSATVSATSIQYEAEEGSLSGDTVTTKSKVNNNHTNYTGTGFVEGFDNKGAAVTFYTNVKTAGDYSVNLRYANASGSNQKVSVFVNGKRVKQTLLTNLANWDTWGTKVETLALNAGQNIITYKYSGEMDDSGNVNIDNITVPFSPIAAKFEAESSTLTGGSGTNKDHWFYSGSGFADKFSAVSAQSEFQVDVPSAGSYQVSLKYSNGATTAKTMSLYVNGTKTNQMSFPVTGSWNDWKTVTQTVSLNSGSNKIAVKYDSTDSGNVNLDRLLVSSSLPSTIESEKNLLDNGGFDRDTSFNSNWTEWHPTGQTVAFGIDSGSGINPPESPFGSDKRAFMYAPGAYKQSIHQMITVPENNAYYKFEGWVKLKNTIPTTARAEITNYGGSAQYINLSNNNGWKYISLDNIYVTNNTIDIGFYVDSPGGTTLHIDEVSVIKK
ncbi:glycosyl hydrolase family 31 [Fictibacillus phosphorivorans]|uniref:Glycosyl hydrolase family 31 n=1 Tax=Fictibacillus phosphorivorans TaxID=1221500 RepID=A0A160IN63_9BACL|nr:TIM-barrel domain-containing protein [Fictibacillus phosphorivorans]ANC77416.1 glycosyl hydrolase family 31 [Fictibacillus phosphorivorans]